MIPGVDATRQACRLVDEVVDHGVLSEVTHKELVSLAVRHPARVAEMLAALAGMLAQLQPPDMPDGEEAYVTHLKQAHAAYIRGETAPWVLVGERAYNTLRRRQQRERKRAG